MAHIQGVVKDRIYMYVEFLKKRTNTVDESFNDAINHWLRVNVSKRLSCK